MVEGYTVYALDGRGAPTAAPLYHGKHAYEFFTFTIEHARKTGDWWLDTCAAVDCYEIVQHCIDEDGNEAGSTVLCRVGRD